MRAGRGESGPGASRQVVATLQEPEHHLHPDLVGPAGADPLPDGPGVLPAHPEGLSLGLAGGKQTDFTGTQGHTAPSAGQLM